MSTTGNFTNPPGTGAMNDTLNFVKNLWGNMKVPGMVMPTMSVNDINKQIADLKAVEAWLTMNMNMLRATIQALEVQSATLTTLQAMSENMNSFMQAASSAAAAGQPAAAASSASSASSASGPESGIASDQAAQAEPAAQGAGMAAPPFANPAMWWNLLQEQFNQAVNTATTPESEASTAKAAAPPKRKSPKQ